MNLRTEALSWGLKAEEIDQIVKILGREPNRTELGIFAVMWSEHCSYKSTKIHLKKLPTKAPQVLQGPGENAGLVALDEKFVVAFKIESHNHPSYIEPYQGASTGVGGILRDIFTMGARPVALLNSLSFGDPEQERMPYLIHGVVSGIGDYGNCMGIPTVGGECHFHSSYNGNILVNAMAVGVTTRDQIFKGRAENEGDLVLYLGSATGSDGIHGATMASEEFDEESEKKRPTVQVGDPFMEKIVLEACLEIMSKNLVSGIQDMGAAGLACSTFEMAERGGSGMQVNLDEVPLRQQGLTPYEMFLSESQERMLLVARPENVEAILNIAKKWDVPCALIGKVTKTGHLVATWKGDTVVDLPIEPITNQAPMYDRPYTKFKPATATLKESDLPTLSVEDLLQRWLTHPNLSSRRWIYKQFDHTVGNDTIVIPGADASLMRVKGSEKRIAMTVDSRSLLCKADPYLGIQHVVCEAARNLACVGATPLGLSNCLNFGSPEIPEVMGEIVASIEGLGAICEKLNIPVTGGNVSLYNTTSDQSIYPTPTIGLLGVADSMITPVSPQFKKEGDTVFVLGLPIADKIYAGEFASTVLGRNDLACPPLDVEKEKLLHDVIRDLLKNKWVESLHDCSEGGLAQALLESCNVTPAKTIGAHIDLSSHAHFFSLLFGEYHGMALISVDPQYVDTVKSYLSGKNMPFLVAGKTGKDWLEFKDKTKLNVANIVKARETFFENL